MGKENNAEEFYDKLKSQLLETSEWPSEYLFKFIVLSDKQKIKDLEDIFNNMGAIIYTKASKNGKYTSVSMHVVMKDPDAVVEKYKEVAEKIEGVISL